MPRTFDGHWNYVGQIVVSHVYLTQDRLQACSDDLAGGRAIELRARVAHDDRSVAALLKLLSHEASRGIESSRLFVEQAIDLLCQRLISDHSSISVPMLLPRHQGLADWQIKRVASYVRANLAEPIGLDELASQVGLSRYYFCAAFRAATGCSPYAWVTAERIRRARELLDDPSMAVTEVALAVGYATPSSFAAAFRKSVGVTPSGYRRLL